MIHLHLIPRSQATTDPLPEGYTYKAPRLPSCDPVELLEAAHVLAVKLLPGNDLLEDMREDVACIALLGPQLGGGLVLPAAFKAFKAFKGKGWG